ncbi:TfoX/Sxy family protein [Methanosarcinaceae archaeon]|nr:TfoX/Sxy family protein [Methanosarcinaceae archaeon]MBQ3621095.1 TfoX/Sxy family protein [Methanosarcinaceae archaeon]
MRCPPGRKRNDARRKNEGGIDTASDKEYLDFVLDQLSGSDDVTYRMMMGEYIIYYQGKVIGGIYDNRFLVKKTKTAEKLMPDAPSELPYEGGKEMLLVDVDDTDLLNRLIPAVAGDLPAPKKKKRSGICFCLSGNPRTSGYSGDPDFLFFRNFPVYHICFSSFRPRMR